MTINRSRLTALALFPLLTLAPPLSPTIAAPRGFYDSAAAHPSHTRPIPDVVVQTQDGRTLHFYSDLVKGRVVAINFIFTSCTTICPLMGVRFAHLQQILDRKKGGHDVALISVSIDPLNDTPARLAAWAKKMGARPGWTLVTGAKPDLDALAQSLGASSANPTDHAPVVLIIDDRSRDDRTKDDGPAAATRQRLDGLTDPARLAQILGDVVASRHP